MINTRSFNARVYPLSVNVVLVVDVRVAPTPELAREVIVNPVPLVSVLIAVPLHVVVILIVVEVGTDATKYAVPAVIPLVVVPNTITSLTDSPCAEPVEIVSFVVIVVQVGVVPPSA